MQTPHPFRLVLSGLVAVFIQAGNLSHAAAPPNPRANNTSAKLMQSVTLEGVRAHQAAFQLIADANNGIRTSGTPGYDQSVEYVAQLMTDAGYDVAIQPFGYQTFISLSPTVLEQVTPRRRGRLRIGSCPIRGAATSRQPSAPCRSLLAAAPRISPDSRRETSR